MAAKRTQKTHRKSNINEHKERYFYLLIFIVLICFLVHLQSTKNERLLANAGLQCAHIFIDLVELPLPVGVVKKLSVIETVVIRRVGDRM